MVHQAIHFKNTPFIGQFYLKLLTRSIFPTSHKLNRKLDGTISNISVCPIHLRKYQSVCHLHSNDFLPITYPSILAAPLHGALLTSPYFSLNPLGLIHLKNRIVQFRRIKYFEPISAHAFLDHFSTTDKGTTFEITTLIRVHQEVVWKGQALYLSKNKYINKKNNSKINSIDLFQADKEELIDIPSHTGRSYARVSRDYNPIHLSRLTALLFGFKKPIVHGMWLASLVAYKTGNITPHHPLDFSCEFRKSVPCGSSSILQWKTQDQEIRFQLIDYKSRKIQLSGHMSNPAST